MRVLVTGATGYIGGRLVPYLLAEGHEVRCAVRSPDKLATRTWRDKVEVVRVDLLDPSTLDGACEGVDAIHYLVHAMDGEGDFESRDRQAAENLRDAAAAAGVQRIVYLGGLGHDSERELSKHLRSRQEVGRVLADGPVAVTEIRAAIIIGSGSASFEMLRHLVEVLPVMTTPRWVDTKCQPIAIRDVLHYLVAVLDVDEAAGEILEVGGPEALTYRELMHVYADVAGLRRRVIIPVPVLTPRLSSLWVGLVTPLPTGLARPLVDSLVNEVVADDQRIRELIPRDNMPPRQALELAMTRVQDLDVDTTWASAGRPGGARSLPEDPRPEDPSWSGGTVLSDDQVVRSAASPEELYRTIKTLGGTTGYFSPRWMWEARGLIDKMFGGFGLRRGRRHPHDLAVGEAIDFWRVEMMDPPHRLLLRAEMKLPGEAWLEFTIKPRGEGSVMRQRARFHPRGLFGRVYWYGLLPFHTLIFPGMARKIARAAESGTVVDPAADDAPATDEAPAADEGSVPADRVTARPPRR